MAMRLAPPLCAVALGVVAVGAKPVHHAGDSRGDGEHTDDWHRDPAVDDNADYTKYTQGGGKHGDYTKYTKGDYNKYAQAGGDQGDYHKYMKGNGGEGGFSKYMQEGGGKDAKDPAESWHKYMGQGGQGDYTKYMKKYGGEQAMKYLEKYGGAQADYQKYVARYSAMAGGDAGAASGYAGKEASQTAAFQEAMKETYAQYIPGKYAAMAEKPTAARGKGDAAGGQEGSNDQDYQKYIEKYWGKYANKGGDSASGGEDWMKYVEKYWGKYADHSSSDGSGGEDWKQYVYKYWGKYAEKGAGGGSDGNDWHKYLEQRATKDSKSDDGQKSDEGHKSYAETPKDANNSLDDGEFTGVPPSAVFAAVEEPTDESSVSSRDAKVKAQARATLHAINKYAAKYMPKDILKSMTEDLKRKAGEDEAETDVDSAELEADQANPPSGEAEISGAPVSAVLAAVEEATEQSSESSRDAKVKAQARATLDAINKYAAKYMPKDILKSMTEDLERKAGEDQARTDDDSAVPEAGDAVPSSDEAEIIGAPGSAVLAAVEEPNDHSSDSSRDEEGKAQARATLHAINKYAAKYMPKDILKRMTEDLERKAGEEEAHTDADSAVPEVDEATPSEVADISGAPVSAVFASVEEPNDQSSESSQDEKAKVRARATLHAINKYAAKYMPTDILKRMTEDLQRKAGESEVETDGTSAVLEAGEAARSEKAEISGAPVSAVFAAVEETQVKGEFDVEEGSGGEEQTGEAAEKEEPRSKQDVAIQEIDKYAAKYMPKDVLRKVAEDLQQRVSGARTGEVADAPPAVEAAEAEEVASGSEGGADTKKAADAKAQARATLHAIDKYAAKYMPKDVLQKMTDNLERDAGEDQVETDASSAKPVSDDEAVALQPEVGVTEGSRDAESAVRDVVLLAVPEGLVSEPLAPFLMAGCAVLGGLLSFAAAMSARRRRRDVDLGDGESPFLMMA